MTGFQVVCDQCDECLASCFCHSDGAFLCPKCDLAVHAVNKIAQRHVRVPHESCPAWAYQDAKSRGRLLELEKPSLPKRSSSAGNGFLQPQLQQQQHSLTDHSMASLSTRAQPPSQHHETDRRSKLQQQQQLPHIGPSAGRGEHHTSDSSCNLVSLLDTFNSPSTTKSMPASLRPHTTANSTAAPSHSGNNAQHSGSPMAPGSPDTSGDNPCMSFALDGDAASTWATGGRSTLQQQHQCGGRFSVSGSVGGAGGGQKRPLTDLGHMLPSSGSSLASATANQSPCLSPHQTACPSPFPGISLAVASNSTQQPTAPIDIGSNLVCRLGSRGHSSRDTACTLGSAPSISRLDMSSFGTDSTLLPSAASNAVLNDPSDPHRLSTIGSSGSSFLGGQIFQAATPGTYDGSALARNSSVPLLSEYAIAAGTSGQINHILRSGSNQAPMTGAFSKEGLAGMLANLSAADLQSVAFTAGSSLPVGASMMLGGGGGFNTQGSSSLAENGSLHGAGGPHLSIGGRASQSMSGTELLSSSYLGSLAATALPCLGRGGSEFASAGMGGFQTSSMSGFGSLHGAGSLADEYGGSVHGGPGGSVRGGGLNGGVGGSLHGGSINGSVHGGSLHGGMGGSLHGGIGSSMLGLNIGGSMHGNGNGLHSAGGSKHGGVGGSMRGGGGYFGSYADNMYGAGFGGSLHGGSILSGLGVVGGGLLHTGSTGVHGGSALTTSQSIAALALSLGVSPSSFTDSGLDTLPQLSSETRHVLRGSASASVPISLSSVLPSLAPTIPSHLHGDPSLAFPPWNQQLQLQQQYLETGLAGSYSQAPASRSSGMAIRAGNTSPFAMDCGTSDLERTFPACPQNSAPAVLYSLSGEGSVHSGSSFNRTASVNRFRLKRFLRLQALTEAGAKKVRAESRKVLAEAAAARPRTSGRPLRNSAASPSSHEATAYAHSEGSPLCLSPAKGNGGGNTSSGGGASTEGSNLAMACIAEEVDHLEGDSGEEREGGRRETRHHGSNLWQQHLLLPLEATTGGGGTGRQSQLEARLAMQEQQLLLQQQQGGLECWQGMDDGHALLLPQAHQQPMSIQESQQLQQQVCADKDASLTPLQRRWQQQQQPQPQLQPQQQQPSILPFLMDDDHITDQDLAALGLEDLLPADLCQGMLDESEASGDSIYMQPQQGRAPCDQLQQQQLHPNSFTQPMDICGVGALGRSMFGDLDLCHDDFNAHHHDLLDDPLDCALKVFMSENDMPFF